MPESNPMIGETWEMNDSFSGDPVSGVVVQSDPHMVRLLNRLGRTVVVPATTFPRTWSFRNAVVAQNCQRPGCTLQAVGRADYEGALTWLCFTDISKAPTLLLPHDDDALGVTRHITMDTCVACGTNRVKTTFESVQQRRGLTVERCGACLSEWVLILGSGKEDDNFTLTERSDDAAKLLEHRQLSGIRAVADHVAFNAIGRAIGSRAWRDHPSIIGTPLELKECGGSNRVVVFGRPHTRNLSILSPGSISPVVPVEEGAPVPNETWWNKDQDSATVVQIVPAGPDAHMVSFRTSAGMAGTLPLAQFYNHWFREAPKLECKVGEEWTRDSEYFQVMAINEQARYVSLSGKAGVTTVDFKTFAMNYAKSKRTSAYDRLLGDDDF